MQAKASNQTAYMAKIGSRKKFELVRILHCTDYTRSVKSNAAAVKPDTDISQLVDIEKNTIPMVSREVCFAVRKTQWHQSECCSMYPEMKYPIRRPQNRK